jgi:large subunit ribosomal protein L4
MPAPKAPVLGGKSAKDVSLDEAVFGVEVKPHLVHEAVRAEANSHRQGTGVAKSRGLVSGGRAKPWRQKGTGRARQGSIRAVQWRGGGIAHGPKPRDYRQRTPKKMVSLALRSALSDRCALGKVVVVDEWPITAPRTKDAIAALEALGLRPKGERAERVLLVLDRSQDAVWKSFRNLGERVQIILTTELNAYDVLVNDSIVFSRSTLESLVARFGSISAPGAIEPAAPSASASDDAADEEGAE